MIRIQLPIHLRVLAQIPGQEIQLPVDAPITINIYPAGYASYGTGYRLSAAAKQFGGYWL